MEIFPGIQIQLCLSIKQCYSPSKWMKERGAEFGKGCVPPVMLLPWTGCVPCGHLLHGWGWGLCFIMSISISWKKKLELVRRWITENLWSLVLRSFQATEFITDEPTESEGLEVPLCTLVGWLRAVFLSSGLHIWFLLFRTQWYETAYHGLFTRTELLQSRRVRTFPCWHWQWILVLGILKINLLVTKHTEQNFWDENFCTSE